MFTRDIKSSVILDFSKMIHEKRTETEPAGGASVQSVDDYIAAMKKHIASIKEKDPQKAQVMEQVVADIEKAKSTLGRSLSRLHKSMPKPTSYEDGEQLAIRAFTSVGIDQKVAEDYAEVFVDTIKKTQLGLAELKVSVDHSDGIDFGEMKDLILDPANFTEAQNKERFLSIFRGMKKSAVRTSNFGAHQIESAISTYLGDATKLAASVKTITGKDFGKEESVNQALAKEYIAKINERADFLSRMYALYNGAPQMGGLEAVMLGKDNELLATLFAREDFAAKLKDKGVSSESLLQYIKDTGITLPIPSLGLIGSYTSSIDTKRNEAGLRSNNSHLGEAVYVESNLFGLVDQARGKEPATFGKVVADIVRTVVRPVEVGASIDRRSRLIENSALVTALSWNAIFDMKTGTVNEAWEGNIAKLVEEFQKSNSLPEGFNKEAFVASMKEKVAYFDSIKSTGDKAQAENVLKLGVMRQTFVNQAAELTASRVDQGAKFDGVSAGLALLVLPFVKFNTSNVAVSRQGVSEASNDIARASASLARGKEGQELDAIGFTLTRDGDNYVYTPKEGVTYDYKKVTLPEGVTLSADGKSLVSKEPLSLHVTQNSSIDIRKGVSSILVVKVAEAVKAKVELKDMYTLDTDGRTYTFNDKLGKATIDFSAVKGAAYDEKAKKLTLPAGVEVVMKPEKGADGILTKIVFLPKAVSSVDAAQDAESLRKLEKSLGGSIYIMSREAAKYPDFTEFLVLISGQRYSEAASALGKMKKYQVTQNIIKALGGMDAINASPDKLAVLLTYTYGAMNRLLGGNAKASDYSAARKDTHRAEVSLAPNRANDANEATFSKIQSHTPTPLTGIYGSDRSIAVSVFATPLGGRHRIDKVDGSINVSKEARADLSEAQKKAVIDEHGLIIQAGLDRVNAILPKSAQMKIEQYKQILLSGKIEGFPGLEMVKKAEFFEARAMIQGNFCANKVEGMVLPSFRVKNEGGDYSYESSTRTPQYTSESIFHGDRMVVDGNTIGIGALKTRPKGQDKPDGSTQPGQQPEPNGSTTPGVIRDGSTGTTGTGGAGQSGSTNIINGGASGPGGNIIKPPATGATGPGTTVPPGPVISPSAATEGSHFGSHVTKAAIGAAVINEAEDTL